MTSKLKILLADDDRDLVQVLVYAFEREGFAVTTALDGDAAVARAEAESPDLIVLDLMMPKRSGMAALGALRKFSATPILVLTALSDEDQVVRALELGADDYLVKPFRTRELKARIHALLRRTQGTRGADKQGPRQLVTGSVRLDLDAYLVSANGQTSHLTRTEFGLLHYLMLNHDRVMSVPEIIANVWGYDAEENDKVVKVFVSRLRRKIEPDPSNPRTIVNVPGLGYKFQSLVQAPV